jgi:hypothetical protein
MGQEAALFLVRRLGLALLALLTACSGPAPTRVDPARYDAFFLWAGVKPPAVLERAETLYLLAGEVRREGGFVSLRGVPRVKRAEVWLVVRVERLDWDAATTARVLQELARWQAGGSRMAGLQIDFDASSKGLEGYAAFLTALRARLPAGMKLSITGLMDWSANADPTALASLKGVVDEVVVQSYQGRETIPGYEAYLAKLARVPVPHKVALVEGGEWQEPAALNGDPLFRGYVVFLVNPEPEQRSN